LQGRNQVALAPHPPMTAGTGSRPPCGTRSSH
jgi:hypothetical protein